MVAVLVALLVEELFPDEEVFAEEALPEEAVFPAAACLVAVDVLAEDVLAEDADFAEPDFPEETVLTAGLPAFAVFTVFPDLADDADLPAFDDDPDLDDLLELVAFAIDINSIINLEKNQTDCDYASIKQH